MTRFILNRFALAALVVSLPACALADLSGTQTLAPNSSLNLDTGTIGTGPGGDLLWNGSTLTPQGRAKAVPIYGSQGIFTKESLDNAINPSGTSAPIPSFDLLAGWLVAASTNGGNTAAALVTANNNGSLTLQFTTFSASTTRPSIRKILNNSSDSATIAQGSLFKIVGSNLSADGDARLQDSQAPGGLPTTLNGATVTITAGGTVIHPGLYYATPTQIAGVLPSATPVGAATVAISVNGVTNGSSLFYVVAASPGITTYQGSGVAQHALTGTLVTYTDSAKPGEILIIWGTGFGPMANSDTTYDTSGNQTTVPYAVYIGGVRADVSYKGASVYPGVGVLGVTIPANVPSGCFVSISAVATVGNDSIVGNTPTIPIAANGGACSDPQLGYDGNQISILNATGTVKTGFLMVSNSPTVTDTASATFRQSTGITSAAGGTVSIGSCIFSQTDPFTTTTPIGLDIGTLTVTGPGGAAAKLGESSQSPGFYIAALPAIPSTGATYVFNATGGSQVGSFSATANFPNPRLVWTNELNAIIVNRGLTVTWTGGVPGSYVSIERHSAFTNYLCLAPQSAGTFTVPSYILQGMYHAAGNTKVTNWTNFSAFSASGLDFGGAMGYFSIFMGSSYQ